MIASPSSRLAKHGVDAFRSEDAHQVVFQRQEISNGRGPPDVPIGREVGCRYGVLVTFGAYDVKTACVQHCFFGLRDFRLDLGGQVGAFFLALAFRQGGYLLLNLHLDIAA